MCRNHSHIIADMLGEETGGTVPVLTFLLANSRLTIEPQWKTGSSMIIQTSGQLFVPSWVLGGSYLLRRPPTADVPMSLCLLPAEDMTTIQEVMSVCLSSLEVSKTMQTTEDSRLPASGIVVERPLYFQEEEPYSDGMW